LLSGNAPRGTAGALVIGSGAFPAGLPLLGATLFVDPTLPLILLSASTDGEGRSTVSLSLPGFRGGSVVMQALWLSNGSCTAGNVLSASPALRLTFQ
jgi:hypothetical protein